MPEVVGAAIIAAAASASITVPTTIAIGAAAISTASLVGGGALLAGGVAFNLVAASLTDTNKVASQQFSSRQPLPARQRSYGLVKLAGPKVAFDTAGGAFLNAVYHGEGPYSRFRSWNLDDTDTGLSPGLGGINAAKPWRALVTIESHLGTADQAASPLLSALPYWDATHRLAGCAYTVWKSQAAKQKDQPQFYPRGTWPELTAAIEASIVRHLNDPAQTVDPATWTWSDQSAPCICDFLTHWTGLRIPAALIDTGSWQAFESLCGETVHDKAGTAFPRYYLGGTFQLTDDPVDTLQAMLDTCDGRLTLEAAGTIGVTGGKFPDVSVSVTNPPILSMSIERGGPKLAAFNRLKITYVSPVHDFQQVDAEAWDDVAAQTEAGELLEEDFSRPWVQNFNQVRRLAKIHMAKGNPDWTITDMVTDLSMAPALFEEAVHLTLTDYGISETFLIDRAVSNGNGTCTFDLRSIRPAAYAFDPASEEGTAPALSGDSDVLITPDAPADLSVAVERRAVNGSNNATFLRVTADALARADYALIGRYRLKGTTAWSDMVQDGDDTVSLTSSVLADGQTYQVQAAVAGFARRVQSDWTPSTPAEVVATADPTAPAQPQNFTASAAGSGATVLDWTNPASANFSNVQVRRASGAAAGYASATVLTTVYGSPNQPMEIGDSSLVAGAYRYWLVARNASGTGADPLGPVDVAVT